MQALEKLQGIIAHLKNAFVGKDEIADLLAIGLVAKENAFLLGPPGTAKSAIIRLLAQSIEDGRNFEYLLTRFTEPAEIFGPFDIRRLREGELLTNTEGMLPEASLVFLDELFNANSAILNSLLTALNERTFRRGRETRRLPALMFVGASNALPEDETLAALLDRFLIRVKCDYVNPDLLEQVLLAGRRLDDLTAGPDRPAIAPQEIGQLQQACLQIDLSGVIPAYIDLVHNLRSTGIRVSDRRAVKLQNLVAASALLSGRAKAAIVDRVIAADETPGAHPQAGQKSAPDPEELAADLALLSGRWESGTLSPEHQNVVKDKLRYLQSRSEWIGNGEQREYLQQQINALWQKILQTA
jgi:MoxR-like ATPase